MKKFVGVVNLAFVIFIVSSFSLSAEAGEIKKKCNMCHKKTLSKWDAAAIKHVPYSEEGCDTCHSDEHKKFNEKISDLCLVCHEVTSESIKSVHFSADVTGTECAGCHNPHASEKEGLLKEFTHMPFASRMCNMCHKVDDKGKITVKGDTKKTCIGCHSDVTPKKGEAVHPAYEMMECTDCHNPHTADYAKMLNKSVTKLCFDCHNKKIAEKHPYDVTPSQKIKDNELVSTYGNKIVCVSCHKPHAARIPFLLKDSVERGKLCKKCHK